MIGAWLFGSLSDVYGRKKIAFLALLGCICTGLGYSLASSFLVFALFRLLFGLTKQGFIVAAFTLMVEVVGASKRTFVTIVNQAMFTAGICALPLLSYYIRSWRTLSITISLLGIGFLSVWKWIPESPRWLLVQGREEEARAVLTKIARGNGRKMTVPRLKRPSSQPSETTVSVTELFRTPVIRHRTLILLVAWFTNCMVYYGLSMSAGSLGGGRYISVALSGLVELPGLYINYRLLNRVGRKWTQGGFLILAGICCVLWALGHWAGCGEPLTLTLALAGKCAVANSFCALYLFSAELFPTEVRSLGMGVVSVASRLGGIMSPIILIMGGVSLGLPMVVMGCLGLLAGLLSLHLPETLHQPLPETLAELEHRAHITISTYPQIYI
ncbi:Solute carrier family 22 member 15 [Geodia barretti]|uniref:Solute carrier family 22 member 15 n=1 Tax=Geodia barretti TaxID=519541 RepID=A0AA35RCQ6_GEOBA|nr:Solute carrier family 22 member 15 [Geodia barretti]